MGSGASSVAAAQLLIPKEKAFAPSELSRSVGAALMSAFEHEEDMDANRKDSHMGDELGPLTPGPPKTPCSPGKRVRAKSILTGVFARPTDTDDTLIDEEQLRDRGESVVKEYVLNVAAKSPDGRVDREEAAAFFLGTPVKLTPPPVLGEDDNEDKNNNNNNAPTSGGGVVKCSLKEMPDFVDAAIKDGFTPLITDKSEAHLVDTFYSYQSVIMMDSKKHHMDYNKSGGDPTEMVEAMRKQLVGAMQHGNTLAIVLGKSVPMNFLNKFDVPDKFPVDAVCKKAGIDILKDEKWAETLMTKEDTATSGGVALTREGFKVMFTSHFQESELDEYSFSEGSGLSRIGKDAFRIIEIQHTEGTELMEVL